MTVFTLYFCDKSGEPKHPLLRGIGSNLTCDYRTLDEAIMARDHAYDWHDAKKGGPSPDPKLRTDMPPSTPRGRIAIFKSDSSFDPAERVA